MLRPALNPSSQRGLSVVEMLVGVAIGLIIVAAATMMVAGQLADNRRLLLETQVQQDLRAASDLITRELRRAGYWKNTYRSTSAAAILAPAVANPYVGIVPDTAAQVVTAVTFTYANRNRVDDNLVNDDERLGFRLSNGVIESQLGSGNWQPLTDPGVLRITGFAIQPRVQSLTLECPCTTVVAAGPLQCPPQLQVRSFSIGITAEAANDSRVQRSMRTDVRVRNDQIVGVCQ